MSKKVRQKGILIKSLVAVSQVFFFNFVMLGEVVVIHKMI